MHFFSKSSINQQLVYKLDIAKTVLCLIAFDYVYM